MMERRDARSVLLQAAEQLGDLEDEHGEPVRVFMVIAYSFETEACSLDGIVSTPDPMWVSLALLNRAYEAVEAAVMEAGDE